jgi:hypothetical protein
MAGFAVMCGCLYEIVGRLLNREWSFCAMILPLACPTYYYAVEARGYGLELGFAGLALLAWMLAAEGRSRSWAIPLLAVSAAGAVASHYYAVLLLAGLGLGELARTAVRRRVDCQNGFAFGASIVPVLAFSSDRERAVPHPRTFGRSRAGAMASWYLGPWATLVLPLALIGWLRSAPAADDRPFCPAAHRALESGRHSGDRVMPVVAVLIAKFVTHAFTFRYAIAAFPAVCVLLVIGFSRIAREARGAAAALWLFTVVAFVGMAFRQANHQREELSDLRETAAFLRANSAGAPVVISDLTRFHRLSFYARRDLGGRVVFLSDPHLAIRYMGFDTADRGLLDLNPWFPLNVRWFHEWIAEHPSFLVWTFLGNWSWIPNGVADLGLPANLKAVLNDCALLSVTASQPPPNGRRPGDPSGRPMLYSRMPADGLPMCRAYMAAGSCPAVD